MKAMSVACWLVVAGVAGSAGAGPAAKTPREALHAFQDLIGSWKGTGLPARGTREERARGLWQETITWQWQFKGKDAWLLAELARGKHFARLELRYLPGRDRYRLDAVTAGKEKLAFEGALEGKRLTLDRLDAKAKGRVRLVFSFLHPNRYLYRGDERPDGRGAFTAVYQVGCTKQGVAFATVERGPECVVSGGLGTMAVSYKGRTYYVCCGGCRDAFKDEPEKYVKEFEARKKAKKD